MYPPPSLHHLKLNVFIVFHMFIHLERNMEIVYGERIETFVFMGKSWSRRRVYVTHKLSSNLYLESLWIKVGGEFMDKD